MLRKGSCNNAYRVLMIFDCKNGERVDVDRKLRPTSSCQLVQGHNQRLLRRASSLFHSCMRYYFFSELERMARFEGVRCTDAIPWVSIQPKKVAFTSIPCIVIGAPLGFVVMCPYGVVVVPNTDTFARVHQGLLDPKAVRQIVLLGWFHSYVFDQSIIASRHLVRHYSVTVA